MREASYLSDDRIALAKSIDLGDVRCESGRASVYSAAWTDRFLDLLNANTGEARRQVRRLRIEEARTYNRPMRIAIELSDGRSRRSSVDPVTGWYDGDPFDSIEVYGWRAALYAIRAMGGDREARTDHYRIGGVVEVTCSDALLDQAIADHG